MRSPRSLSGKARFSQVFDQGRRGRSDGVTVWVLPRPDAAEPSLGLSVGTKSGGAVARNQMRRRVRALIRALQPIGADVVIRTDRTAMGLSFQELAVCVKQALTRAGLGE
jgi:ribonuclease P protein component